MSFSITIHGHAGNNMEPNGEVEIEAARAVVRDIQLSFADRGLSLGYVSITPSEWNETAEPS